VPQGVRIFGADLFGEPLMLAITTMTRAKAPGIRAHLTDLVPSNSIDKLEQDLVNLPLLPATDLPDSIKRRPLYPFARAGHSRLAGLVPGAAMPKDVLCSLDLLAMIPRRPPRRMAPTLGLAIHEAPMAVPVPPMAMIRHRRASGAPARRWPRDQVARILGPLDAGGAPLPRPACQASAGRRYPFATGGPRAWRRSGSRRGSGASSPWPCWWCCGCWAT